MSGRLFVCCRDMTERLRLAELVGALSLATDLGMGQPLEQALRTCLIALAIGDRMGLGPSDQADVFYVALLRFLGCTADAHDFAALVGGDDIGIRAAIAPVLGGTAREFASGVMPQIGRGRTPLRRARLVAGMMAGGRDRISGGLRAHCELAENLASRLGLSQGVRAGLSAAFEQWSGQGLPDGLAGEAIPVSARVVFIARDVEILQRQEGGAPVRSVVRKRTGVAYDPAVGETCLRHLDELLALAEIQSPWDEVLRCEPEPRPWIPEGRLDSVLEVFADFVDLKSPFTPGHSREVARLAAGADDGGATNLRRAGLLHDLGRVAVPNGIWDKPGPLTDGEWERVRLHPYYTERILSRVTALKDLAMPAGMHHERLDGSGYHRGSSRSELPSAARMLAAADVYQAMTQPRPHRPAKTRAQAAEELEAMAAAGRLDREAVRAVLGAAGHDARPLRTSWPADLSEREVEVLRLICRGGTKREVARALSISPSTVDHHVRHIYEKARVQTRAGATLFALEHDLLK
jgi:HD-GYP domain-containing protein (c-di-GMP phosphodiesterase class II)